MFGILFERCYLQRYFFLFFLKKVFKKVSVFVLNYLQFFQPGRSLSNRRIGARNPFCYMASMVYSRFWGPKTRFSGFSGFRHFPSFGPKRNRFFQLFFIFFSEKFWKKYFFVRKCNENTVFRRKMVKNAVFGKRPKMAVFCSFFGKKPRTRLCG